MRSAVLTRKLSYPDCTLGEWVSDSGFRCFIVERPWLDNSPNVSCVPPGTYQCNWQWSPKHLCNNYHLQNVPDRSNVEIHSANVAEQLEGCLAPGTSIVSFQKDSIKEGIPSKDTQGVSFSKEALSQLEKDMRDGEGEQVSFMLTIIGG